MKFGRLFGIFLNSAHLICRSTDISKCFRGSLRLRDNESRLYLFLQFESNGRNLTRQIQRTQNIINIVNMVNITCISYTFKGYENGYTLDGNSRDQFLKEDIFIYFFSSSRSKLFLLEYTPF